MCINYKSSIISYLIGMISGLLLILDNPEKKAIGFFILFYTQVQLLEAIMYFYRNNTPIIYSKLLLINLGLQGLIFFLSVNSVYKVNDIYFYLSLFISFYLILETFNDKFKNITIDSKLNWNFLNQNQNINILLVVMYLTIFYWFFTKKKSKINTNYLIDKFGILLFITLIISYLQFDKNCPSIWCMSSAFIAPILLVL